MDRRACLTMAVAALLLGALWLAIASLVFVWLAGLLPAYSGPGWFSWGILWAWVAYLGYDGANAKRAEHLLRISGLAPLVVLGLGWAVWRQLRERLRSPRPLYGETKPADSRDMQDAGLSLKRRLR